MSSTISSTDTTEGRTWTCGRCEVSSRFPGLERADAPPPNWAEVDGEAYCLACRRARAADEAAAEAMIAGSGREDVVKVRTAAVVEFEIARNPDRRNGEIARSARCSPLAVVKARKRLEG